MERQRHRDMSVEQGAVQDKSKKLRNGVTKFRLGGNKSVKKRRDLRCEM